MIGSNAERPRSGGTVEVMVSPLDQSQRYLSSSWLFFCVARSTRMTQIWALYRQSGADRLEKQPTDLRRRHHYMRDGTLGRDPFNRPARCHGVVRLPDMRQPDI